MASQITFEAERLTVTISMQKKTNDVGERSEEAGSWSWYRLWPLAALAALVAAYFIFDLDRYVNFAAIKEHDAALRGYVKDHLVLAVAIYVLCYAVMAACSLPGGLIMTFLGGYLFGTWLGGGAALVGATIGATAIYLAAKTALGDVLRARAGGAIQRMAEGFQRDAFNYLLFLRLIPLFPFFLVNLVPAFLGVKLGTYVTATFLGIMPATFIFAGVGNGLGRLLAEGREPGFEVILAPEILLPLIGIGVLALVPVVYRHIKGR